MIFKQGENIIGLAARYKNFFIFKTKLGNKTMLVHRRGWPTYLLSSNPQIRLKYSCFGYISNTKVVQALKLEIGEISRFTNKPHSSKFKLNNNSDVDTNVMLITINKIINHNL